jgi:hypothetical protein
MDSMAARQKPAPTQRRSPASAEEIGPQAAAPEPPFEKITMTVPSDLREAVALAAVKLKVSESAFYTAGARELLNIPEARQRLALRGAGKRRKT